MPNQSLPESRYSRYITVLCVRDTRNLTNDIKRLKLQVTLSLLFSASGCPIAIRNKAKGLDPLTGINVTGGDVHGSMKGTNAATSLTSMGLKVRQYSVTMVVRD